MEPFSFTKCETRLHGILESGVKLRIIIDALDECNEAKELLKALLGPSGATKIKHAQSVIPRGLMLKPKLLTKCLNTSVTQSKDARPPLVVATAK